ncbi:fatty acid-binding protein-like [Oratosquilla oratoria]|uniref:fatty acid-binding protein-like n=1 Tax=Oratosquilla oratoria TaxID=337810 RepID=UPI003F76BFC0
MVQFVGTYKHEKDENLEEVFAKMGMNFLIRKMAASSKPTVEVSQDGDKWTIKTIMSIRTLEWTFTNGEALDIDSPGGKTKAVFTVEGDKIIQTPEDQESGVYIERIFNDEGMVQTMLHKSSGTKAMRAFKRS